eukprot:1158315_1
MSLLFTILLYVIYASNSQTICIWGASETNQMLNGEYTYHCCINGQSYYRTTVDSSCSINGKNTFYLYNYNNILWLIGDAVGSTSAFATCQSSSVSPTDCSTSGKWIAGFGNSNVEVTSGSCPQSNCGIIATSFPSNNICATTFNQKIDVNQWEGYNEVAQQYVYFYFAPQWFKWVCADHVDEGCNIHYHDKSEAFGILCIKVHPLMYDLTILLLRRQFIAMLQPGNPQQPNLQLPQRYIHRCNQPHHSHLYRLRLDRAHNQPHHAHLSIPQHSHLTRLRLDRACNPHHSHLSIPQHSHPTRLRLNRPRYQQQGNQQMSQLVHQRIHLPFLQHLMVGTYQDQSRT